MRILFAAVIGPDGKLLNRHRKLLRRGDGRGLNVVATPAGRIGTLICWENYMPLARMALYAQNLEVLVAPTWDTGEEWVASMRHIVKERGCFVIGEDFQFLPKPFSLKQLAIAVKETLGR